MEYGTPEVREKLMRELDGAVYYAMNALECTVVYQALVDLEKAETEIAALKMELTDRED